MRTAFGSPLSSISSGIVTCFSTSSGAWPGKSEITVTCTSVTSGNASTGSEDRKSTRLNSSHGYISYPAFCLDNKIDLARGQTDFEIGAATPQRREIVTETMGTDLMLDVMRPDHPLAERELTARRFA